MALRLGQVRRAGRFAAAAVTTGGCRAGHCCGGVWGMAHKVPVALLIAEGGDVRALTPDGAEMALTMLEAALPGVIAEFRAALAG